MDSLFYSLEEAAAKLGKSTSDLRNMADKKLVEVFRHEDKTLFSRQQIDLLASTGGGDEDIIPLAADSGELEPLTPASSGTAMGMGSPNEGTGISLVDADATDDADANAVTRVSAAPGSLMDPGEKSGSGGLLDLTKEADDTSLGAGLMEDVYGGETVGGATVADAGVGGVDAGGPSGLFESAGGSDLAMGEAAAPAMAMAYVEVVDTKWSMLLMGAAVGVTLAMIFTLFVLIIAMTSTAGGGLLASLGAFWWAGAALGVLGLLVGVVLMLISKK
jgi:hypothetical protein